jgi:hypothetical protein
MMHIMINSLLLLTLVIAVYLSWPKYDYSEERVAKVKILSHDVIRKGRDGFVVCLDYMSVTASSAEIPLAKKELGSTFYLGNFVVSPTKITGMVGVVHYRIGTPSTKWNNIWSKGLKPCVVANHLVVDNKRIRGDGCFAVKQILESKAG